VYSITIAEVRKGVAKMNGSLMTLEQTVEGGGLLAIGGTQACLPGNQMLTLQLKQHKRLIEFLGVLGSAASYVVLSPRNSHCADLSQSLTVEARIDTVKTTLRCSCSPRNPENKMLSIHQIQRKYLTKINGMDSGPSLGSGRQREKRKNSNK